MSRLQAGQGVKRKQPDSNSSLTEHEKMLYDVIRSKRDIGIWIRDLKRETNLLDNVVNKSLKSLQAKKLIKEVINVQNKGKKHFMAVEFEPSKEITGGAWYVEGSLDKDFIKFLKDQCFKIISKLKIATLETVTDSIRRSGVFKDEYSSQQIEEIVNNLVLDNVVMQVRSTGTGEFSSIRAGIVCYRCINKSDLSGEPKPGAMASIPCGVCPRINYCTPDGIISPKSCEYYSKWLDF